MTTIVYKDNVIAYDSRCTNGDLITSDKFEKKLVINGVVFFMAGFIGDFEALTAAYFDVDSQKDIDSDGPCAMVVDNGKVFLCSIDVPEGKFWKQPLGLFDKYAIGSGSPYALGAMEMGASAVDAVKISAKLDCRTGGKIKVHKIKR